MDQGKKILIIDDEVDLCVLMKNYLERRGFVVHYAHTLQEGMDRMRQLVPDILFLDNNLPDGTAWSQSNYFYSVNAELSLYLMSGYQPTLPDLEGLDYKVMQKPISFADLANVF